MGKKDRKRGAKVPKPASLPRFIAEESLLTALRADSSPFQSPPHSVTLSQDNLLCLSTAFVDYRLRELEKWAEVLNTVNSKGSGSFFVLSEGHLVLRTASVCSTESEERALQVRRIVTVHNEGLFEEMKRL